MSKKDVDARKALEILQDAALDLRAVAERLCVSPEAVDEARYLADEMEQAAVDAILAMPPVLGRALLWASIPRSRQDVLAAAVAEGEKEVQREAKRIAHNLKQKGVEIALPTKAVEQPRPAAEAPVAEPPVFLSSLDGNGERAVFWTRNLPGRGIELAQLVISDERGIVDLLLGELSRKRFRELVDELPRRGGVTIREVSRGDARQVLDRARVAARETGNVPAHYPAWAAQVLGPAPASAPPPLAPKGEGQPLPDPAVLGELVTESHELFSEPELARWSPGDEALRSCAAAVEAASSSNLYLDDVQRQEGVRAAIERCAEGFFDGRRRTIWAARLLDTGRLFEETGRNHAAKIASATARILVSGAPLAGIPFATQLFARLFLRQRPAQQQQSASSVLLPGEAGVGAPERTGETETPADIVIPD
ncbi:hypothetical protein [Vulgatibacter sp.]|uniref:hypothetical protein n=1 Tax=Vulgatibacter sp. TaxID=1971226 RepID=UPI0035671FB2